ncbi:hypothetical protein B0X71_09815 [Planococcus lenghuensis]|uniref:Uncharacterized protein n=1 Tax=Planococcus lenghuensis TaxID=2213202 RepID=A0A1Q2KYY4_9BACL|nr:hypothetical protein B0X71_09815 [Planococcus lenghuensis]
MAAEIESDSMRLLAVVIIQLSIIHIWKGITANLSIIISSMHMILKQSKQTKRWQDITLTGKVLLLSLQQQMK